MAKAITKKTRAIKPPKVVFDYKVNVSYNGKNFECETNDLLEALTSIAPKLPEYLKTHLWINITKGDQTITKMLLLPQAKLFFRNELTRKMFIKSLFFKN